MNYFTSFLYLYIHGCDSSIWIATNTLDMDFIIRIMNIYSDNKNYFSQMQSQNVNNFIYQDNTNIYNYLDITLRFRFVKT